MSFDSKSLRTPTQLIISFFDFFVMTNSRRKAMSFFVNIDKRIVWGFVQHCFPGNPLGFSKRFFGLVGTWSWVFRFLQFFKPILLWSINSSNFCSLFVFILKLYFKKSYHIDYFIFSRWRYWSQITCFLNKWSSIHFTMKINERWIIPFSRSNHRIVYLLPNCVFILTRTRRGFVFFLKNFLSQRDPRRLKEPTLCLRNKFGPVRSGVVVGPGNKGFKVGFLLCKIPYVWFRNLAMCRLKQVGSFHFGNIIEVETKSLLSHVRFHDVFHSYSVSVGFRWTCEWKVWVIVLFLSILSDIL